jgi:hypothetical protein
VFVIPPLSASTGGGVVTVPGRLFRLSGSTLGVLDGRPVVAEYRLAARPGWHRIGAATVHVAGRYARLVSLPRRGRYLLRWHYHGGRAGQWMSSVSRSLSVVVR